MINSGGKGNSGDPNANKRQKFEEYLENQITEELSSLYSFETINVDISSSDDDTFKGNVIINSSEGPDKQLIEFLDSYLKGHLTEYSVIYNDKEIINTTESSELKEETAIAPYMNDFDLLWDELQNSYPYYEYFNETIDMEELYKSFAAEVATIENEGRFVNLIQRLTKELGGFAHLGLISNEQYQMYYYLFVLDESVSGESNPFSSILQDPRLSDMYVPPVTSDAYEGTMSETFGLPYVTYYDDCNALYIKITSFSHFLIGRDENIVYDALTKYPDTENVIFDIRGNQGGSTSYWDHILLEPFGGCYEYTGRQYFKSSELVNQFWPIETSSPVDELEAVPEWVKSYGLDRYNEFRIVLPENGADTTYNDIKRWVLVDEAVYSSSESFVNFCKVTNWATVVGYKTSGDGMGSTPLLLLLPDSGLLVRFSYVAAENDKGECDAVRGTVPDLICFKKDVPLNKCLDAIREQDD